MILNDSLLIYTQNEDNEKITNLCDPSDRYRDVYKSHTISVNGTDITSSLKEERL